MDSPNGSTSTPEEALEQAKAVEGIVLQRAHDALDEWWDFIYGPDDEPERVWPYAARPGYVYILQAGDYYKIGRTTKLDQRIKALDIQLPEKATLILAWEAECCFYTERMLHYTFREKRANGEWFKLAGRDVLQAFYMRILTK